MIKRLVLLACLIATPSYGQFLSNPGSSGGSGSGSVTSVSVTTANGVSGSVANPTTTPAISLTLGAITPSSVAIGSGSAITSSGPGGTLTLLGYTVPGTGVATALGINIGSAGAPILFNGAAGTPTSLVGTNITGTAAGLTAGNVTTNANLTGDVTSVGNATTLAWITRTASQTLAIGAGGTLGSNAFTSTAYLPLTGGALTGGVSTNSQITSTLAIGTAPFVITSTTLVPNLYVQRAVLADSATTNANLTGPITSVGNATSIASQTGTGTKFVVDTSPTLVTPNVGVATGTSVALNGATIGSNAIAGVGQFASFGATTTGPGFYSYLTGDTVARVRIGLDANDNPSLAFGPGSATTRDTFLMRIGAGIIQHGTADVDTAPVAQVIRTQGTLAGPTSNVAGANFTFIVSPGKGTGVGGSFIVQTVPAGSTGTVVNSPSNALLINSAGNALHTPQANTTALSITSGSITGSSTVSPGISVAGTLNTSGVVLGAGLFANITNTAAGAGSTLLDIQQGGVSRVSLTTGTATTAQLLAPAGSAVAGQGPGLSFQGFSTTGFGVITSGGAQFATWVGGNVELNLQANEYRIRSGSVYGWSSATNNNAAIDTGISRDSAGVIDIGTGAQGSKAGSVNLTNLIASGYGMIGSTTALTLTSGALGMQKITASASAPGAAGTKLEAICGTNAGTAKLVMYAGTSGTAVTVIDNVGSGVSGC